MKTKTRIGIGLAVFLLAASVTGLFTGCAERLAADGPFGNGAAFGQTNAPGTTNAAFTADGLVLYHAEDVITTTYDALQSFVAWEHDNAAVLAQWPEIHASANVVRANAKGWLAAAIKCNEAYRANPTSANGGALRTAIAVMSTALAQAQTFQKQRAAVALLK